MIINVGDLLTVLRLRDEATPVANQLFQNLASAATATSQTVARNLTPAIQSATQAAQTMTPAMNAAAAAVGGGGGGAVGGGGGGAGAGGGGGGGLGGAAAMTSYQLTLLGRGLREAGYAATAMFTVPIVGSAAAAVKFGVDFETVTTKLVTLAGVTQEELEGVKKGLLELAPATGIGPVALGEAMLATSSILGDTATAMDIVTKAAGLSSGGLGETAVVAKALTTIINSYGVEVIDAGRASDVLVRAIRDGGAEAKDLAPVLANVVPFAAKLGVSFEQVAANLSTVTKLGVPTSEAVTQLVSVFAMLARETNRGEAALKTIDSSYADLRARIAGPEGLAGTLIFLADKFGLNDGRLFDVVGRLEALKNILGVTGPMASTYTDEISRMGDAHGESAQLIAGAAKTLQVQWNQLVASLQVAAIELSTSFLPILKDLVVIMRDSVIPALRMIIDWFNKMPVGAQQAVIAFLAVMAAIGPVLNIIGLLLMALGNLDRAFGIFTVARMATVFGFLQTAFWPATAAFLALAAAIAAVWAAYELGKTETVKNAMARWTLAGQDPVAMIVRNALGIEQLSLEEAKLAVAASAAAEGQNKLNKEIAASLEPLSKIIKPMASHARTGKGGAGGADPTVPSIPPSFEAEYKAAIAVMNSFNEAQKREIMFGEKTNKNFKDIAAQIKTDNLLAVEMYIDKMKKLEAATEKAAEKQKKFLESIQYFNKFVLLTAAMEDAGDALQNIAAGYDENGLLRDKSIDQIAEERRELEAWLFKYGAVVPVAKRVGIEIQKNTTDLSALTRSFERLARVSQGPLEGVLDTIGKIFVNLDAGNKMNEETGGQFGVMSQIWAEGKTHGERFAATIAAIGHAAEGVQAIMRATAHETRGAVNAMMGAKSGALIGSAFGPWGALVGAIAGAITGLVRAQMNSEAAARALRVEIDKSTKAFKDAHPALFRYWDALNGLESKVGFTTKAFMELDDASSFSFEKLAAALGMVMDFDITEAWQLEIFNIQVAELERRLAEVNDEFNDLFDSAIEIGIGLPNSIQASIMRLIDLGVITGETAAKFHTMLWEGEGDWKKMLAVAEKYGITEAGLGKGFQVSKFKGTVAEMINEIEMLIRGGGDVGGILSGASDEISKVVQNSLRLGTEIPANMKPWIEELIKAGKLLDENGNAITDIGQLRFGDAIKTEFQKIVDKLQELIDKLGEMASATLNLPAPPTGIPGSGGGPGGGNWTGRPPGGIPDRPGFAGARTGFAPQQYQTGPVLVQAKIMLGKKELGDAVIEVLPGRLSVRGGR